MNAFDRELSERLAALREQGLYRELRRIDSPQTAHITMNGRPLLNFSSNDYLGLANEPALKEAAMRAVEQYGAGAGASRLISGSLAPHHTLEEQLAAFKGVEAALSFATGYAAGLGAICALMGKGDVIILDKLVHACLVDAARLSGATLRVFAHNELNQLEARLQWAAARSQSADGASPRARTLIITESVFSMDGDQAPLRGVVELKERYGAWLMVDEAHATGLYGAQRRGLVEALGLSGRVELQMGTLGKAIGASGGYICGSRALVELLINRARTFIFSTAPVPAAAAAAEAGVRFIQSVAGEHRRETLWQRVAQVGRHLSVGSVREHGAIIPLIVGDESRSVETAAALRNLGFFIPAIRYPTVARGSARLRLTLTASHSIQDVSQLLDALRDLGLLNQQSATHAHAPAG
jgi:8-amino-7-oxononanoate synthase